jgi:hypothetical protein
MAERPAGWPEDMPYERMTRERFEHFLLGIRNAVSDTVARSAVQSVTGSQPGTGEAVTADLRAVSHAAEVALGILRPGYVPKAEAIEDVRNMMRWVDGDADEWTSTD